MTAVTFASPDRSRRPQGSPFLRRLNTAAGMALPGPGGLPVVALGLILVLRTSTGAKRLFIKAHRRWPRVLSPVRRLLRRNSPFVSIFWQMMLRAERFITRGHGAMGGWRRAFKRRRTA
jgi:hypothetical protein